MTIGALCTKDVATVQKGASVEEAARLMRERHVGDVVVVGKADPRIPVGILTDRDIAIGVVGQGLSPESVLVEGAMSGPVLTLREEDDVLDAIARMAKRGVRRAPVVDREGRLCGLVSVDDLVPLLALELAKLSALMQRGHWREVLKTDDARNDELAT